MVTYARKRGLSVATVVKGHFPFPSASPNHESVLCLVLEAFVSEISRGIT